MAKLTDAQRDALATLAQSPGAVPFRQLGPAPMARALHARGLALFDEAAGLVILTDAGRAAHELHPPAVVPVYEGADPAGRRSPVPEVVGVRAKRGPAIPKTNSAEPGWGDLDDSTGRLDYVYGRRRDDAAARRERKTTVPR